MPTPQNSTTPSGSGSATPTSQVLDAYRPLAAQVKKPIQAFLPSTTISGSSSPTSTQLQNLLQIPSTIYTSRLSNKNILLDAPYSSSSPFSTPGGGPGSAPNQTSNVVISPLVVGRKRNLGNERSRLEARREMERKQDDWDRRGVVGLRKAGKLSKDEGKGKGKEVMRKGMKIGYATLLPLHYLHTMYLCNLLNLPPLPPSSVPPTSTSKPSSTSNPVESHVAVKHTTQPQPQPLPRGLSSESIHSKLVKADFTGIELVVRSSRNPSLIGKQGIVIEETYNTFRLVESNSKVLVIPKDGSLFKLRFPAYSPLPVSRYRSQLDEGDGSGQKGINDDEWEGEGEGDDGVDMELHLRVCPRIEMDLLGSAFMFRSGDRAGRKFRPSQGGGGGSGWGEEWVHSRLGSVLGGENGSGSTSSRQGTRSRSKRRFAVATSSSASILTAKGSEGRDRIQTSGMTIGSERRKRDVGRRKDPLAGGSLQV